MLPLPQSLHAVSAAAVELVARGEFGRMVVLRGSVVASVQLAEVCARLKLIEPDCELVRVAHALGVNRGGDC